MSDGRLIVIGLDGVPYSLLREWTAAGVMPTLAGLMSRGIHGGLASTVPPTSAPSWSSFVTGMNPGKTGIFDFLYRRPGSYHFPPVNASLRQGRPIWAWMNDAGKTTGIVNLPMAYPVDRVDGFMISGWMTPYSATDYLYPPELAAELARVVGNYRIYPTETFKERTRDQFFQASYDLLEMLTRVNLHLVARRTDFFLGVYFDTDRILHQLWHYLDPGHPWRKGDPRDLSGPVKDYFREQDRAIGRILEATGPEDTVVVMSDHGMGAAYRFVVLNNWLLDAGFLRLRGGPTSQVKKALFRAGFTLRNIHILVDRLGLAKMAEYKANYFVDHLLKRIFLSFNDVDWSRTRAYSYGRMLGSIYLNVKGREPQGIVEPGAPYEALREEMVAALDSFRDPVSGRRLIGRVARREEVFQGSRAGEAPDLILWPDDPTDIFFGLTDFGDSKLVDSVYRYSGMHRPEGLLVAAGPSIRPGAAPQGAGIADLAPTMLHLMGLPVPADMDGRVLLEILSEPLGRRPVATCPGSTGQEGAASGGYSAGEEEEIMERLADLGYLG
jgi:predicted AlkP superfamily phosphohydrolase/phosphomutase